MSASAILEKDEGEQQQPAPVRKFPVLDQVDSIDVCFLVDCTGTMSKHLASLRQHLTDIVKTLSSRANLVRVAFVGYRDVDDEEPFCIVSFSSSIPKVIQFLDTVRTCGGGGDAAEDVFGGLQKAIDLEWSNGPNSVKCLVHIADGMCPNPVYILIAVSNPLGCSSWPRDALSRIW